MRTMSARNVVEPWPIGQLNRLVMAARTMPGTVGAIPARHWWPALILMILDVDISAEMILKLPAEAMDARHGRLTHRYLQYQLHAQTLEAFEPLPRGRSQLLPWPKDGGRAPFHMLYRDFKTVLYRAGLPYSRHCSFVRLQVTTRQHEEILNSISPILDFAPVDGKPQLLRARDRRRHAVPKKPPQRPQGPVLIEDAPDGHRLVAKPVPLSDNPETLRVAFFERFRPTKLRQVDPQTAKHYERSIALLYSFAGRELTFRELTDDLLQEFLSDCFERGAKPGTCNHYRADLLALWRFGWTKRLTDEQPRDVPKLKVNEVLPCAWNVDELERIIEAATRTAGDICGVPAKLWWPAFVLSLYDTGLRFNALMRRDVSDLDLQSGWLTVSAEDQKQRKGQALKLHNDTMEFIRATEPDTRQLLFPWPYRCHRQIRKRYREILEAAGLPTTKRDLFHKLRRTSATWVCVATDEQTACDHLGHSDVSVTRRYLDRRLVNVVAVADIISRPAIRKGGDIDN